MGHNPNDVEVISTQSGKLVLPGGESDVVSYAVLPRARIVTSHRRHIAGRLVPDPTYPDRLQHRAYSGRRAISVNDTFIAGAQHLDPRQLLDSTSSTALGPPVVARRRRLNNDAPDDFLCIVGNHRVLITDYAKTDFPDRLVDYEGQISSILSRFSLPPDSLSGVEQPIVVRILTQHVVDEGGPDGGATALANLGHINRLSDASFTKARDPASLGYVYARELLLRRREGLDRGTLSWLIESLGTPRSTNSFLSSADGSKLLRELVAIDVLPREELTLFLRPNDGGPTAFGALCVRSMLFALAFDDSDVLDGGDPTLLGRLQPSLGHLIATRGMGDWDITAHIGRACMLLGLLPNPYGARWHLSSTKRRTGFADIESKSEAAGGTFFLDNPAPVGIPERRALAFARAIAGIFLCEIHQSADSLTQRFLEWRATAQACGGKFTLDMFGEKSSSPAEALHDVFCRTSDVSVWVKQQLTPPYNPSERRTTHHWGRRLRREVSSLEEGLRVHSDARAAWESVLASAVEANGQSGTLAAPSSEAAPVSRNAAKRRCGRGRPLVHCDADTFAACAIRTLAPPVLAGTIVQQLKGPSERQCRRRVSNWKRNPAIWAAVRAVLPELGQVIRGRRSRHRK